MTDRKQFEAMLEALINEDQEAAKEIFHNIVVAKSREIYEELLENDFGGEEEGAAAPVEEEAEEDGADDSADDSSEDDSADDSADDEEGSDDEVGGDATDDFVSDVEDDDSEGDMDDAEQTDRILDLEDALEELKAEFEQLMAGDEGDDMGGDDMGADMGGDDMGADMGGDEFGAEPEGEIDELAGLMEYVNKVSPPEHGDNGTNTKSIVAGKNDMGGTTANIAKSFSTTSGGTEGGLAKPSAGDLTSGLGTIHNRVDSKSGKTAFKKHEPGHGPEKAGKKETADNKQSVIAGLKSRNK